MAMPPHVVLVPVPAQGHINPFISLAHFLAASGISVTLVHSTRSHSSLLSASVQPHYANSIRIELIPHVLSSTPANTPLISLPNLKASIPIISKGLEELLQKLMQEDNAPCCLIADGLLPWCHDVVLKFRLPRVVLWTSPASALSIGLHIPDMVARGYIPAIDAESRSKIVDFIPGLSPIRIADMPTSLKSEDGLQSPAFQFLSSVFEHSTNVERILVNTINELESHVLEALRTERGLHIHPVGPLFLISSTESLHSSLLQEDNSCLAWLHQQCESSVLYISFGSIAAVEEEVFEELALGLEASGESFLWVIRPDAYKDKAMTPQELLPEGFMERTKDRGLVISWAPQLAVLGHPSVGAFLTHCGWNSVLESLSNGKPMLCFPQQAEQSTICKFIVHDWAAGLSLLEADVHKVERTCVQRAVNAIMKGVEGTELRKRAVEWRDAAHKAPHGISKINLQKFVDDLKNGRVKPS